MPKKQPLRILITWELGGDLGHIGRLIPVAGRLQAAGYDVVFALRDLSHVHLLPAGHTVVPAPGLAPGKAADALREPATFADILYNQGVTADRVLAATVRAWRGLFELVQPAVVIQDFSPTALLALQGWPAASLLLGTGFACPPGGGHLPELRAWQNHYPDRIRQTERQVLAAFNQQLAAQRQPPLQAIGELYERVDANFLATFAALDHYPQRHPLPVNGKIQYCGVWSGLGGASPQWPEGTGARIFAYLKPFRGLPRVLDHLVALGHPTLVYLNTDIETSRWQSPTMKIRHQPLAMHKVAADAGLALLHAGHGSTARMLLAGTPIVQLPVNVEQYHTAVNTERLGAGIMADLADPAAICAAIDRAVASSELADAASSFAREHASYDAGQALETLAAEVARLAGD